MTRLRAFAAELGALRVMLLALAGALALAATPPGIPPNLPGFGRVRTLILPAAAPLAFFVRLFDLLMSAVRLAGSLPGEEAHWRRVLIAEAVFALWLLLAWLPFFLEVLTPIAEP